MDMLMKTQGWNEASFQLTDELSDVEQMLALCHGRVQAIIAVSPHPNAETAKALKLCDAVLVHADGPGVEKLIASNSYFVATQIPTGVYPGQGRAIESFGVVATVISAAEVDAEITQGVVDGVFSDLDGLKRRHPSLAALSAKGMSRDGLTAPLHDGAERYFRAHGLQ